VACAVLAPTLWLLASLLRTGQPEASPSIGALAKGKPQRIISVNLGSDEILLALVPEQLVAVSHLATEPGISNVVEAARAVPEKIKADPERILALKPDLVVIGGQSIEVARQLERVGLRVIRLQGFESLDWIKRTILTIGEAIGEPARARHLVAGMDERLDAIARRVADRRRPTTLSYSPFGSTAGRQTIFDDVIRAAGGTNVAAEAGLTRQKKLSLERLLLLDPEVIVTNAWAPRAPAFHREFLIHPALQEVRAFKTGRVHALPGRLMVTVSHHIVETVETLARLLHPEVFQEAMK
jgi:iron complex transport system substrate-binding protein